MHSFKPALRAAFLIASLAVIAVAGQIGGGALVGF